MRDPGLWDAMLADPTLPFDREALRLLVRDQRRWSRRYLCAPARALSRLLVALICVVKRLLPFQWSAHATMDRLCVWFLRHFVSEEAGTLLVRHFLVETNLLNFIARNAGVPGVREVALQPASLGQLGGGAVIDHDLNVYDLVVQVGEGSRTTPLRPRPAGALDFSMLAVQPIDPEPARRRLLRLDVETALCLMNIPFALCLTADEYRRAVHSLRLDESLLAMLATITGDPTFRAWRPAGFLVSLDTGRDVPRAVFEHAVVCEYAHAWLGRLRDARPPAAPQPDSAADPTRAAAVPSPVGALRDQPGR